MMWTTMYGEHCVVGTQTLLWHKSSVVNWDSFQAVRILRTLDIFI